MAQKVFAVSQGTLKEIAQSLLEAKKMARSLENVASSLSILADDLTVKEDLAEVETTSAALANTLNNIYKLIAREALAE